MTIERNRAFLLSDQNLAIDQAWRRTTKGARFERWKLQAGGFSFVRGFETGFGFHTGWGSHQHMLAILHEPRWPTSSELLKEMNIERRAKGQAPLKATNPDHVAKSERRLLAIQDKYEIPVAYLLSWLTKRFREEVERQGFCASSAGQDWEIDVSDDAMTYVLKGAGNWDAIAEAVGGAFKTDGLLSVWDLLRMARDDEDPDRKREAYALVREFAEAMHGRKVVTVSRDLKLRPEQEEESAATKDPIFIELSDDALKQLRWYPGGIGLAKLLDVLPSLWKDVDAINIALGECGFGLNPDHWRWVTNDGGCVGPPW